MFVGAFLSLFGLSIWAAQGFNNPDILNASNILSVLSSAFEGNAAGIVYLGVIILVGTPIFRVAVSVLYFGLEKDRAYIAITLVVLGMLVFALVSGAVK